MNGAGPQTDAAGRLLDRIPTGLAAMETEANRLDRDGGFPEQAFAFLNACGAMTAPLPRRFGGLGAGTEPEAGDAMLRLLRLVGHGSLAVGRLYEGHVNAIRLIVRYGTEAQQQRAAEDARAGHLFGIWVTDGSDPLRLLVADGGLLLQGGKLFASGARHVTRPLVTAQPEAGPPRMLVVPLGVDRHARDTLGGVHGMRGACTGSCDFTGVRPGEDAVIGAPGDYLRQPEFSAGAWRGIAVALGGIDRLVDALRDQLRARGRHEGPHQLVRIGEALIARETAAMWASRASRVAEQPGHAEGDVIAVVGLARIAAEQAALDVIRLVQRGLGLGVFLQDNPAERVMRDLATYLRQPAPDETLCEAAGWFTTRDLPA
ncbi:acyl-CoA dehydrogenase family protein [Lichenicoccus roseus]|nr:acyl-CoA dehydrogenase family protein [Lichenicoccus roseus]